MSTIDSLLNKRPVSPLSSRQRKHRSRGLSSCGTCHLLSLPRELRDKIYEFALHEPGGLFYRYIPKDTIFRFYTTKNAINIPYPFILHSNQLKYACRQLYNETKGLSLRYNTLHFSRQSMDHPSAGEQFEIFWKCCSPKQQTRLRHIWLHTLADLSEYYTDYGSIVEMNGRMIAHPGYYYPQIALHKLMDFCLQHPSITVNMRLPQERGGVEPNIYGLPDFLYSVAEILHAYRGVTANNYFPGLPSRHFTFPEGRSYLRGDRKLNEVSPENLRFWPCHLEVSESQLKRSLEKAMNNPRGWIFPKGSFTAEEEREFIRVVRGWYETGF